MKLRVNAPQKSAKQLKALVTGQDTDTTGEAKALVVGIKLTNCQYKLIGRRSNNHNCNLYPPYETVVNPKV